MEIKVSQIKVVDKDNRVNSVDNDGIIASIKTEGVLCPLLCYKEKEDYILVAGHRRLASAIHFGLENVPVEIISKEKAEIARALENIDRKNLNIFDECSEILKLYNKGYSVENIAKILEVSPCRVYRRMKLKNICEDVKKEYLEGKMNIASLEEFATIPTDKQKEVLDKCFNYNPENIRTTYFSQNGFSLKHYEKEILSTTTKACNCDCRNCPMNPVSEKSLFSELENEKGICKDIEKLAEKIIKASEQHPECNGLCSSNPYWDEEIIKILENKGVHVFTSNNKTDHTGYLTCLPNDKTVNAELYFSIYGSIYYDISTVVKDDDEDEENEKSEEDTFRESFDEKKATLLSNLEKEKKNFITSCLSVLNVADVARTDLLYRFAEKIVKSLGFFSRYIINECDKKKVEEFVEKQSTKDIINLAYLDMVGTETKIEIQDKTGYINSFRWVDSDDLKYVRGNLLKLPNALGLEENPEIQKAIKKLEKAYENIDKLFNDWNTGFQKFKKERSEQQEEDCDDFVEEESED